MSQPSYQALFRREAPPTTKGDFRKLAAGGEDVLSHSHSSLASSASPPVRIDAMSAALKQLQILENEESRLREKVDALKQLSTLGARISYLEEEISRRFVHCLISYPLLVVRVQALRALRFMARDPTFVRHIAASHTGFLLSRALEREKDGTPERIQAFKAVHRLIEVGPMFIPRAICATLVSIAETPEDPFCIIAMETLCCLVVVNPHIVAFSNGIRTLFKAAVDPTFARLQESLLRTLIYLLNEPISRPYIRISCDIRYLLAPLTDTDLDAPDKEKPQAQKEHWRAGQAAIVFFLKNWTGLISLAADPLGLRSLVETLRVSPHPEVKDLILDALFAVFRIPIPQDKDSWMFSSRQDAEQPRGFKDNSINFLSMPSRAAAVQKPNLMTMYISALLIAFVDCGLVEALVDLGKEQVEEQQDTRTPSSSVQQEIPSPSSSNQPSTPLGLGFKATILLGDLLQMSPSLLPRVQVAQLQTLPTLVSHAVSFVEHPRVRSSTSTIVSHLHQCAQLRRVSSRMHDGASVATSGANKYRRIKGRDRKLDRIDDVRTKVEYSMDDKQFLQKLQQTQVLTTKEHTKWDWDLIEEVLEGPLRNPVHLHTATMRNVKFIKRILSFLKPHERGFFITEPYSVSNLKFVRVACLCLELLLQSEAGEEFLKQNGLVREIADLLKDDVEGKSSLRVLSEEKVLESMAREYFTVLGTLSSSRRGLALLKEYKIFSYLAEMQNFPNLSYLTLTSLDYSIGGQSRVLLSKSLTSSSKGVRYFATKHLRLLLRSGVASFANWGVSYLNKQLGDEDAKVYELALSVLDEACDNPECLNAFVKCRPSLALLQKGGGPGNKDKTGANMILKMLSTEAGVEYLLEEGFVETELERWKEEEHINYVLMLEDALEVASAKDKIWREEDKQAVNIPPHFYGELAKTVLGGGILAKSGHMKHWVSVLRSRSTDTLPVHRRAALWAIGHVGASEHGLESFLEGEGLVQEIINMAENAESLSLRGTCYYVLSMISQSARGRMLLDGLGWESPFNNSNICVPKDPSSSGLFKIKGSKYDGAWACAVNVSPVGSAYGGENPRFECLQLLSSLSNPIIVDRAITIRNIKRLKGQHPEMFYETRFVMDVLRMLANFRFKLTVRRFIHSLIENSAFTPQLCRELPWDDSLSSQGILINNDASPP